VHSLFNLDAHLYTVALQSGCAKTLLGLGNQSFQEITSASMSQEVADIESAAPMSSDVNQVFQSLIIKIYLQI
jgi:hypothetical protein